MSAHNVLENQLVADHTLIPPSSGATIDVDRSPALVQVAVTACKLPVPQVAGLRLAIYNNAGSACSVTMLGGGNFQNNDGGTGATLASAGAFVIDGAAAVTMDSDAALTIGGATIDMDADGGAVAIDGTGGVNIGIQSASTSITTGVITALNFVGAGNTLEYNSSTKTVDISIAGGGGGGLGTAIKYSDEATDSPFSYIDLYATVKEDLLLDTTKAGVNTSIIVSVTPNIEIASGVAVTVGAGKTMVIDILKIAEDIL